MGILDSVCKNKIEKLQGELLTTKRELENFKVKYEKQRKEIRNIFDSYKKRNVKIIGISQNKENDNLYILLFDYDTILLYNDDKYNKSGKMPLLYFKVENVYDKEKGNEIGKRIKIQDLLAREKGIGNGTILLDSLINLAEENKIEEIIGDLSMVDEQDETNKQRRDQLYKKFGFEINNAKIKKNTEVRKGGNILKIVDIERKMTFLRKC